MPSLTTTLRAVAREHHLAVARVTLGAYLFAHYVALVPFAGETFGRAGVLPNVALNPAYPYGFTVLGWLDQPVQAVLFVAALAALSLSYLVGFQTRASAVLLFAGSHQLFHRNELTLNPSLSFLGFLLLAHVFFPASPPCSIDRLLARQWRVRKGVRHGALPATFPEEDRVPADVLAALWIVMAVAYTYSGVTKLVSPSWLRGDALEHLLASPLARDTALVRAMEIGPGWLLAGLTWGALLAELLFAPLACVRRLRPYLWLALIVMHAGLILLLDFADISLGMIGFHLFTFDPMWIENREVLACSRAG